MKRSLALVVATVLALLATSLPARHAFAAPAGTPATAMAKGPSALAAEKTAALLDLNSATKAELMKLPGVGDAIADKIIAGRPWKSKYDLVLKKVVTRNVYDKFAKLVVARQPAGK
jgi:competence protein ComEA